MAKNVTLLGANYPDVPAVVLPQTGGGSAVFTDISEITYGAATIDSTYGSGHAEYYKFGRVVIAHIDVTFSSVPGNGVAFASGFPERFYYSALPLFGVLAGENREAVRVGITFDGKMEFNYGATPSGARNYTGEIVYISNN